MDNQIETMKTETMKTPPTPRALRIVEMKEEIKFLGCKWDIHYTDREIWITHLATGWRGYARYWFRDLESIEDSWRVCLDIARGMDNDFCAGKI